MTPSGLSSRPDTEPEDKPYLEGFRALNGSRAGGFAEKPPLQVSEVVAYLHLIGEDRPGERLKFLRVMQLMDGVFLNHEAKKAAAEKVAGK